jgi:CubicO group peptidase (beta-lactamase class C family)
MSDASRAGRTPRAGGPLSRRGFVAASAALTASALLRPGARGWAAPSAALDPDRIDAFVRARMERDHIPGVALAIVNRGGIVWESGYGWADLEDRRPMTTDTLQNVASISKTFTTTAVMQLREQGLLDLDADVQTYLDFPVRNPRHPDERVTLRQLMTHMSSLRDGTAYSRLYRCGDPAISLATWMREYFTPGGLYHDEAENFADWAPGERWQYCNVTFGLEAYIVERVSGLMFPEYCRRRIFARLGMDATSWHLADIDTSRHATPYTWFDNGTARGPAWGGLAQGVIQDAGAGSSDLLPGGYRANCLYNHPNYPDGFLRTSVRQLARYVGAYLNGGIAAGNRILEESTVSEMLTPQLTREGGRLQGLTWEAIVGQAEPAWGHSGGDPGVNTDVRMMPGRGVAAIAFTNTHGIRPGEFTAMLLAEAERF